MLIPKRPQCSSKSNKIQCKIRKLSGEKNSSWLIWLSNSAPWAASKPSELPSPP